MTARVVAALVGVALVVAVLTERSRLLVRPWFAPVLLGTGAVLLVGAVLARLRTTPRAAVLLLLPVVVGAALTPQLVGRVSQGSVDRSVVSSRLGDTRNRLLSGRGGAVTLLEIVVAEEKLGGVALAGRGVQVEAMVTGPHRISRAVMVCCAADARTVDLTTIGAKLPTRGAWVHVDGELTTLRDELVLRAAVVRTIRTPQQPFL